MDVKDYDIIEYKNSFDSSTFNLSIPNSTTSTLNTSFLSNESQSLNNHIRTSKEIFLSYLNKLYHFKPPFSKLNINIKEQIKRKYNSIIFFDWDDTLLCSSFLSKIGLFDDEQTIKINLKLIKDQLSKLEENVFKVLSISVKLGDTFIITNASEGWVESSAKKYLPNIIKLFNKVKIISARTAYENQFPNDNKLWKLAVFRDIANFYNKNIVTNIISFGDSNIENDAAVKVSSLFQECFIKNIKLKDNPKIEDMIKQLYLISKQFDYIHSATRNIFLSVEKKGSGKKN